MPENPYLSKQNAIIGACRPEWTPEFENGPHVTRDRRIKFSSFIRSSSNKDRRLPHPVVTYHNKGFIGWHSVIHPIGSSKHTIISYLQKILFSWMNLKIRWNAKLLQEKSEQRLHATRKTTRPFCWSLLLFNVDETNFAVKFAITLNTTLIIIMYLHK